MSQPLPKWTIVAINNETKKHYTIRQHDLADAVDVLKTHLGVTARRPAWPPAAVVYLYENLDASISELYPMLKLLMPKREINLAMVGGMKWRIREYLRTQRAKNGIRPNASDANSQDRKLYRTRPPSLPGFFRISSENSETLPDHAEARLSSPSGRDTNSRERSNRNGS